MNKDSRWIIGAVSIAAFFFIIRMPRSPQLVDIVLALALLAIATKIKSLKTIWPFLRPYCLILGGLFCLFIAGQIFNYFNYGIAMSYYIVLNYARFLFNSFVFISIAIAVYCYPILVRYISRAVLISTLVMLPVYFDGPYNENIFISVGSGGRLGGIFQENPIIFGLWMGVVFFAGIGLFLESKKRLERVVLGLWLGMIANFILWSATRSVWVSLPFGIVAWCLFALLKERKKKKALRILCITIFAFLMGYGLLAAQNGVAFQRTAHRITTLAQSPLENQIRTKIWIKTTPFFISKPFGLGLVIATPDAPFVDLGAGIVERFNHQSFNSYLEVIVYGGLGAFILFLFFIFRLGNSALRVFREKRIEMQDSEMAWIAAAIFILLDIFFADAFLFRHLWFTLGVFFGILLLKLNPKEQPSSVF
ncbi:MAG: O-antigen ligase family protein [Candidatus Liptonbacteria bacterium]|nr:O-antigen ligase family protein [Candidatus Liptonbacteria bacterium]